MHLYFFVIENFTQLINLLRRSNSVLNDWFLQTKLQKYQVLCGVFKILYTMHKHYILLRYHI